MSARIVESGFSVQSASVSQMLGFVPSQNAVHALLQGVWGSAVAGRKAFAMGRALKAKAMMCGRCILEDMVVPLRGDGFKDGGNCREISK